MHKGRVREVGTHQELLRLQGIYFQALSASIQGPGAPDLRWVGQRIMSGNSFLMVAGERSGDVYGAALAGALRGRIADTEIFGCGGEAMRAEGVDTLVDIHDVALIGISEVVSGLPKAYRALQDLLAEAARRKPAAAILIDSPSLNLRLAKRLKATRHSRHLFCQPANLGLEKWRIRKIKACVDRMLCLST